MPGQAVVVDESKTESSQEKLSLEPSRSASESSSDLSQNSDLKNKNVSFNSDVKVKRIPGLKNSSETFKKPENFTKVFHQPLDPSLVKAETAQLLKELEGIECSVSATKDNRLYGLHALNNLDIAVNGKEVNSMPSYQEIRRNSLNSATNEQTLARSSETPPKPPRRNMTHYAQPAVSGLASDLESVSSDIRAHRKRFQESLNGNNEDSAIASGGDADDSTVTSSYTSRFVRRSPQRREKMSPSRTCMTDSEILRSPTEVLYAVSEKKRNNDLMNMTSTMERPPSSASRGYISALRPRSSAYPSYSSREDLISSHDEQNFQQGQRRSTSENHRYHRSQPKSHHSSRSLDRLQHPNQDMDYSDSNKENTFKTRIQVISPESQHMIQNGVNRKPYKTTINTATDNILYRGNSTDNLSYYHYGENGSHYKIPKNPRGGPPIVKNHYTADHNGSPYRNSLQRPQHSQHGQHGQQQFQSTRLIRTLEANNRGRGQYVDRNMLFRARNDSGHSTSPDRDMSPDRMNNGYHGGRSHHARVLQARSYMQQRSPSTSPTRPPRSRSSPTRESAVVRRANSRRTADLEPRGHSEVRERSRDSVSRRSYVSPHEDRLSKFVEYRGEDIIMPHAQDPNQTPRRASQTLSDRERGQSLPPGATIEGMRDFYKSSQQYKSMHQLPPSPSRPAPVLERPRTRMSPSAGPKVNISEGEVTDEGGRGQMASQPPPEKMPRHHRERRPVSTSALRPSKRQAPSPPVAPSTGKGLVVRRVVSSDGRASSVGRPAINSNVQKAPSMRRIVVGNRRSSVDNGLDSSFSESEGFNGETDQPRPWSSLSDDDLEDEIDYVLAVTNGIVNDQLNNHENLIDRPRSGIMSTVSAASSRPSTSATIVHVHSQPPVKIMPAVHRDPSIKRPSSVVFHENPSTYHTIIKDKQPLGEFGRRWTAATPHSDIDSDYRRELATSNSGLHQEARSRDGGLSWAGTGRLSRGSSKTNIRTAVDEPDIILRSPSTTDLERSNSSAREEERRKVLEIEGVINRQQPPPPQLRAQVSRSASRASRTAQINNAGPRGYKPPGMPRHLSADMDRESQYSGHSSSQTVPLPNTGSSKLNRFDQHRVGVSRVRRSTSNATNVAAVGGVRREINQRKTKLPGGSLTSSVNSSESEQGSHAGQSAISRNTARSNRSVFLHAAAVADIPSPGGETLRIRSLSAESRDNVNATLNRPNVNGVGHERDRSAPEVNRQNNPGNSSTLGSNLKGSKKISRSISLLSPWKPKQVPGGQAREIHYDNGNLYANPATRVTVEPGNLPPPPAPTPGTMTSAQISKPPRPPTAPPPPPTNRNVRIDPKSASSTNLLNSHLRDEENTTPAVILAERRNENNKKSKVSRSVSMPKDTRLAGWFKKRKRVA